MVLGDFNAVSGVDRTGYESVVGPFGHGTINDNSVRLLSYCSAFGLSMLGSWYQRKNIHRHTWISNDGVTEKEIDHVLTNDRSLFWSLRVYRGAELPANTDHRSLAATMRLDFQYKKPRSTHQPLDVSALARDDELADGTTWRSVMHLALLPRYLMTAKMPGNWYVTPYSPLHLQLSLHVNRRSASSYLLILWTYWKRRKKQGSLEIRLSTEGLRGFSRLVPRGTWKNSTTGSQMKLKMASDVTSYTTSI